MLKHKWAQFPSDSSQNESDQSGSSPSGSSAGRAVTELNRGRTETAGPPASRSSKSQDISTTSSKDKDKMFPDIIMATDHRTTHATNLSQTDHK